jgi:hypothetical protein
MVFDADIRAFAFFKGACTRSIYDKQCAPLYWRAPQPSR